MKTKAKKASVAVAKIPIPYSKELTFHLLGACSLPSNDSKIWIHLANWGHKCVL